MEMHDLWLPVCCVFDIMRLVERMEMTSFNANHDMKNKLHNGMVLLNKKNINKILDEFCFFSDTENDDVQYVAGMIGMAYCLGLRVYRMRDEWVMEDLNGNEIGRKTMKNTVSYC